MNTYSWREEMNERVLEIVVYIVDTMSSGSEETVVSEMKTISEQLMEQGYTENEIDSAFSWLTNNLDELEKDNSIDFDRLLSQFPETSWSSFVDPDLNPLPANYPVPLKELDIIGDEEIEHILDHSMRQGKFGVNISEIKAKVANLILNPDDQSNGSFFVFNQSYFGH